MHTLSIILGREAHRYNNEPIKSRQANNQISRQTSSNKIDSSKVADHVKRLIRGRMQGDNKGRTRGSNVLVQVIFIENLKHLILPSIIVLSIKHRQSTSNTPNRRLIHLPPMVIKKIDGDQCFDTK